MKLDKRCQDLDERAGQEDFSHDGLEKVFQSGWGSVFDLGCLQAAGGSCVSLDPEFDKGRTNNWKDHGFV